MPKIVAIVYVKIIASCKGWDVFWDTVYMAT